ncbi:MAG TPA: primosomal protein N', partial [Spirochaetales bacterium]|nr:primosomal protein N' [Spirochaetales bacterium]
VPVNKAFTYEIPEGMIAEPGMRAEVMFGKRKIIGWIIAISETVSLQDISNGDKPLTIKPILRLIDREPLFGAETIALAEWLCSMYFCSLGEALGVMLPGGKRESSEPALPFEDMEISDHSITPSPEQQQAIDAIISEHSGIWYLYGKTGTGKTEVFLQAAEATLKEGRSVLYLVPEIALTHQVIDSIQKRFGSCCAILHSGITPSQKLKEWKRIQKGSASIVVGARSAAFAPLTNLGLIILDEEHEASYKSGSFPHYHARQVALHRASVEKTRIVMGSATPSVEAWHLMQRGIIKKLTLTKRLAGGAMPSVEIVDMKHEESILSKRLIESIIQEHEQGGQTILFLNRRGFSNNWNCKTCGLILKCKQCDVPLTYHKSKGKLICHYCGYQEIPPASCPECSSLDITYSGFGTERIEETIQNLLPGLTIARLDTDIAVKKEVIKNTLADFAEGKIDVLLGTQMVAKGLNIPRVKLVGIVMADMGLAIPDFRAQERTFALITQVAGRAGRFTKGGKVILQTWRPKYFVIQHAANNELEDFYEKELVQRREQFFPPFSRIIRLIIRSKNLDKAQTTAQELCRICEHYQKMFTYNGSELLGPIECPIFRITGYYRYHILLRASDLKPIHDLLYSVLQTFQKPGGVDIDIDVDPQNFM